MKVIMLLFAAVLAGQEILPGQINPSSPPAPASVELRDQFDTPQKLVFPATNMTVLTIADRKGSEQIAGWVVAVKERDPHVDIRGIADVSSVPAPMRGMVRKMFRKNQTHPVMMDWTGATVKRFGYVPGQMEILLLDRDGRVVHRQRGAISQPALAEFGDAMERTRQTFGRPSQ